MAFAVVEAVNLLSVATFESLSLMWMELLMFVVAAILYSAFSGSSPVGVRVKKVIFGGRKTIVSTTFTTSTKRSPRCSGGACVPAPDNDSKRVYAAWESKRLSPEAASLDLTSVVEAMRRFGKSPTDIISDFDSALKVNPVLLPSLEALTLALLRDGNTDLLSDVVRLLELSNRAPDAAVYVGLMNALLRRRDFAGVCSAAAQVPQEAVTPKMRALLVAAETQRGRMHDALEHLRLMPDPIENTRTPLTAAMAAMILGLAAKEGCLWAVGKELFRLQARIESHQLDELLSPSGCRGTSGGIHHDVRRELLEVVMHLQAPKSSAHYHALALKSAVDLDGVSLRMLVQELEGEGATPTTESMAVALLEACKAVKSADVIARVLSLHRSTCVGSMGARALSATCLALSACDKSAAACDFYEKEIVPSGITLDATLTGSLLKAAAQCGRAALAKRLADHAGSLRGAGNAGGSSSDLQRQATMIRAYARERDLKGAQTVFDRLRSSGVTLSPIIFNCMLDAFTHCGDHEGAIQLFEEMKRLNFVDVVGFNTILKAYLGRGLSREAHDLVQEMATRGLQPNKVTFNELLHSKVMAKDRCGIWSIIDDMHAAGLKANPITCSILLKSLTENSDAADIRRIVSLIEEVEDLTDEVLFSSVIEACIRVSQLDLLSELMRRFRRKGGFIGLSAPTYGSMIKAYGQARDIARVRELWAEMDERGVRPTAITVGCMTEALVVNHQPDEAWELVHKELESEERQGSINTVIYSTVLKGFAVAKRFDKVFAVYKEMRSKDIRCNTITYNTMLDACAKCCSMNRASELLQDMKASSVAPDIITYSTIIKGYCVEGDVDRAFHVLEDMKSDGKFVPDEIMYNSILDGCAKQHRVEAALKVLDEMKVAGVRPSNYTLSILVKLLGHARRLGQAFTMVDDMSKQNGFRPNVQVYTCLVQACVLNRRLEKAFELYSTMVADASCRVDDKFYAVLAKGCVQGHQPMKAIQVIRAAYQLPGHGLAEPVKKPVRPVGIDVAALDEIATKLKNGSQEERDALAGLSAELLERFGVQVGAGHSSGGGNRSYHGGGGGGEGGRSRGRCGGR